MQRYIAGRLVQCLVTLLVISLLVFVLARLTGNPLDVMLPIDASAELQDEMSRELGLDQPVYVQYGRFVQRLLYADLGTSIRTKKPRGRAHWPAASQHPETGFLLHHHGAF